MNTLITGNVEIINMYEILTSAQWDTYSKEHNLYGGESPNFLDRHHTKIDVFSASLSGTILSPDYKNPEGEWQKFGYYMDKERLIFIDDSPVLNGIVERLKKNKPQESGNKARIFYDFLEELLSDDLFFLEDFSQKITALEEAVLEYGAQNFNEQILQIRKKLMRLNLYYEQMVDIGETLQENENLFFNESELRLFRLLTDKIIRLHSTVHMLQEYSMQVSEAYSNQVNIRLNNIMKTLTVITAIFLPLTLLVGWYGMNFERMPELTWAYGYPAFIIAAVTVAVVLFMIFKRKKYL